VSPWPLQRIGDISRYVTVGYVGTQSNLFVDSGIPLLRGQNVRPYVLDLTNLKYISSEIHAKWRKSALKPGDVVIVRVGYPGTACVIPEGIGELNAASLVIVRPDPDLANSQYLAYVLNSGFGKERIASLLVGSAQQVLNTGTVAAMEIPCPSLPVQIKIAILLSFYDDLIANNNRRIKLLEEIAQRLYREWFVDFRYPGHEGALLVDSELGPIPQEWVVRNLFDVADVTFGFPFKSQLFNETVGMPLIRIRDIPTGESATFTPEEPDARYRIHDGDILVGMDGDFHMGRWSAGEAWLNQRVVRFRIISDAFCRYALFLALEKPISDWNQAIVGTTVAHLGKRHLELIKVLTPTAAVGQTLSALLDPIFDLEINLRKVTRQLRVARDLLLPRLISGEIDVTDLEIAMPEMAA